jgi:uncharacterized protein (UPF0276 family)
LIPIGFSLQPELRFLELLDEVLREQVDYFEVAPETLWRPGPQGTLEANDFARRFLQLGEAYGKPFVAHGVSYSVGCSRPDPSRRRRWLERIRADHARFEFRWYSDHFGTTVIDGHELVLPLAVPHDETTAAVVIEGLRARKEVVEPVALETTAYPFHLGDPMDEPVFLERVLRAAQAWLVLDLHNVWTNASNAGFDPQEWIDRLPLERVIEIHVSGGSWSDTNWLASGRSLRLDSHDAAVPEEVWRLMERVLSRCPKLRGITLERMEGTVEEEDVARLAEELGRARELGRAIGGS